MSETVNISYEKWEIEELLQEWKEDPKEWEAFVKNTGYQEIITDDEIEYYDNVLDQIQKIQKHAAECGLIFCYQCNCFVEDQYTGGDNYNGTYCVQCKINNGSL
jgi:hypothetical protein